MKHTSLALTARTAVVNGLAVPLAGRTSGGTLTLLVARLTGTLTLVVEASADALTWTTLATVSPTVPGKTVLAAAQGFSPQAYHKWVRVNVTVITDAVVSAVMDLPFLDTTNATDQALFSKELRSWSDGFARTVAESEREIIAELMDVTTAMPWPVIPFLGSAIIPAQVSRADQLIPPLVELWQGEVGVPTLGIDLSLDGAGDEMRTAVLAQSEHRFRRHKLEGDGTASAITTLRDYPKLAPSVLSVLDKRRNRATHVWRGR